MNAAQDAAYLASVLPIDHPLAQVARLQLDAHVRTERRQAMATVHAPTPGYNGTSCGVKFRDSVAHTDDETALNYFTGAGYVVDGETYVDLTPDPPIDPRALETVRLSSYGHGDGQTHEGQVYSS